MKLLPLLFLLLLSCSKADYIHDMVSKHSPKHADRITTCVIKYSFMYDLDSMIVARLIREESDYRYWLVSSKGARGLMQIMKCWDHLLYIISDGDLGKHIRSNNIINTERYYHRIGYNIQMGCIILRHYLDKYGSYELALLNYNMRHDCALYKKIMANPEMAYQVKYIRNIMKGE